MKSKRKIKITPIDIVVSFFVILIIAVILFPLYNMVLMSITPKTVFIREPYLLYPKDITAHSYQYILSSKALLKSMLVTTFVTIVGTIYNIFLTSTLAYCLVHKFPGKKFILLLIMVPYFFDGGLIPNYLLIKNLGLMDTIWSMILPTGINITYLFVLCKMFQMVPKAVEDAARIDGCNDFQILKNVYMPVAKPAIATMVIYYAVDRWNEWYNGMLYIKSDDLRPLQLILKNIVSNATTIQASERMEALGIVPFDAGIKMACVVVSILPIVLLFPFMQRFFINGLTMGAIKE